MNLLIKLLVFSFPVVFAAALFWPTIEQNLEPSPQQLPEKDPFFKPSPIIENYKPRAFSKKIVKQETSSKFVEPTGANIYRWVDGNGQVHFSDQPSHKDAVSYTPKQLGTLDVSDDIKQSVAVQEYQVEKTKAALIASDVHAKAAKAKRAPIVTSYNFSNTNAGQKHGYVLMSGRISGGSVCKQLRVTAYATSDRGRSVRGSDDIRMAGSGSRLFEMKVRSSWNGGGKRRPQWEITNISTCCLSR